MSKNDNLTDLLTDVADAIRAKKGSSAKINPQDFSSEIASIEGGGGVVAEIVPSDITFYDYDGTVLYAYTWEEWLANGIDYQPPLPEHDGLVCQGWTTPNILYMSPKKRQHLNFGAMYITDDGKTRLYIRINDERPTVPLYYSQTVANGVTIDWGDGSATVTQSGTGNKLAEHTYASGGDYVITLDAANGCTLGLGRSTSYFVVGDVSSKQYRGILRKVEIGNNVTTLYAGAFYYCYNLESITLPKGIKTINANAFRYCYSLKHITLPDSVSSTGTYPFAECTSLKSVVMPCNLISGSAYLFYYCSALETISSEVLASIGSSAFINCCALTRASFMGNNVTVSSLAFRNCYSLTYIKLKCDSIAANAFDGCTSMAVYDFSDCTYVPSLANTNAFTSIPSDCKIVVPDSLYDSWIATTNWSTYANYIIKKSEFEAQNA